MWPLLLSRMFRIDGFHLQTTSCPLCGIPCKKEKKDFKQLPKNYALGNMSDKIRQSEREPEIIAVNRGWKIFIFQAISIFVLS